MIYSNDLNNDGLGNQLFRFSASYSLAKYRNDTFCFKWNKENYLLYKTKDMNIKQLKEYPEKAKGDYNLKFPFYHVPFQQYSSKNIWLEGYFQSEKYFENVKDDIRLMFRKIMFDKRTCSIHVRRGDYLKIPNILPLCSKEYYLKAIQYCVNKWNINSFTIYSDDIKWCVENFISSKGINFEFMNTNEQETFWNMQNHIAHIIANSTFSWWAAWLSESDKVIAPKIWFHKDYKDATDKDLIPDRWIRL